MSLKTYLSKQIRLMTLTNFDVMTDEETELYEVLLEKINEINSAEQNKEEEKRKQAISEKRVIQEQLENKIKEHKGTPREINLKHVLNSSLFETDKEGNKIIPAGITWDGLKPTRRIAEFCSEESRAMGLNHNDICWDKIIFKWKHETILGQIIIDGLTAVILNEDTGELIKKKYRFVTASAGQLRTDKVQLVEEQIWNKISNQLMCGMTWELLNEHGGINLGKLMAYTALPCSATEVSDINIDECIVIPDWEGDRTGDLNYITQDYEIIRGARTVPGINFIDGGGMALPGVIFCGNAMTRAPWIKGLLTTFDYIKFCKVNNCEAKIADVYGLEHDLIKENIKVLFTASQFKLWKHYNSWEHYKTEFKKNGCHICLTNYEENWINNSEINYQFLQSLDMTNEEIDLLCAKDLNRLSDMAESKEAMLQTLNARATSDKPYEQALALYPELLRDGQAKETLKAIKKRWTLDGASGCLRADNKRLYVIPDWYAACEYYFLHEENPKGLLETDEVFSKIHLKYDECDVLRSPSLSFEHAIRKFNKSDACKEWFTTKGVYVCYKDWIDRILQMDYDGDMLNILLSKEVIAAAKRRIKEFNFAPLFYDANKAHAQEVSYENLFNAVILAHKYSGIGVFSNMITKLWNKDVPDPEAAGYICMTNNYTIDAAKTAFLNSYEDHPKVKKRVNKAVGGKAGKMPAFFEASKNGRKQKEKGEKRSFLPPNNSTMNRIYKKFMAVKPINMNYAGVGTFNCNMFLSDSVEELNEEIIKTFCDLDNASTSVVFDEEEDAINHYVFMANYIAKYLTEKFGSLEKCYPSIVKYLFSGNKINSQANKTMFWRVFGDIALKNLKQNLDTCQVCEKCQCKIPQWEHNHECKATGVYLFTCSECGKVCNRVSSRQTRCSTCQEQYRKMKDRLRKKHKGDED